MWGGKRREGAGEGGRLASQYYKAWRGEGGEREGAPPAKHAVHKHTRARTHTAEHTQTHTAKTHPHQSTHARAPCFPTRQRRAVAPLALSACPAPRQIPAAPTSRSTHGHRVFRGLVSGGLGSGCMCVGAWPKEGGCRPCHARARPTTSATDLQRVEGAHLALWALCPTNQPPTAAAPTCSALKMRIALVALSSWP